MRVVTCTLPRFLLDGVSTPRVVGNECELDVEKEEETS